MNTIIASALCVNDLLTSDDDEPRILDVRLAEALGFQRPRNIRRIIARHMDALATFGRCSTVEHRPERGGTPEVRYYLNRKQAIYIAAKSETERAVEITIQVVQIFDAVTRPAPEPIPVLATSTLTDGLIPDDDAIPQADPSRWARLTTVERMLLGAHHLNVNLCVKAALRDQRADLDSAVERVAADLGTSIPDMVAQALRQHLAALPARQKGSS